jgi:hypothetical protein
MSELSLLIYKSVFSSLKHYDIRVSIVFILFRIAVVTVPCALN